MSDLPEKPFYDLHLVIPAESLHSAIEQVSHLKGVVFKVELHKGKGQTPTCRTRSSEKVLHNNLSPSYRGTDD